LFYSCSHCNSIKNSKKYEDGIIDCCVRDPEQLLEYQLEENKVKVIVKNKDDAEALLTADLIEETFNSTSTGIRKQAGQVRLEDLQGTMNALYSQIARYLEFPGGFVATFFRIHRENRLWTVPQQYY